MEAVAYGDQTMRFDSLLVQGQEYEFFTHTMVNAQSSILGIPQIPRTFMAFQDVYTLDEFIFADIIGIVVYVSNTQGRDDPRSLYRHVVVMDERNNCIILNAMKPHLLRLTIGEWRRAASELRTLAALHADTFQGLRDRLLGDAAERQRAQQFAHDTVLCLIERNRCVGAPGHGCRRRAPQRPPHHRPYIGRSRGRGR